LPNHSLPSGCVSGSHDGFSHESLGNANEWRQISRFRRIDVTRFDSDHPRVKSRFDRSKRIVCKEHGMRHIRDFVYSVTAGFCIALTLSAINACSPTEPSSPTSTEHDTTSHMYTWFVDTLGEAPSHVYDVCAVNENDVWAVGYFPVFNPLDRTDESRFCNAAHWDGVTWTLKRFEPLFQGHPTFSEQKAVQAFSVNDLWTDPARHWDGVTWTVPDMNWLRGAVEKLWGSSSSNMYFVGTNGSLIRWDGGNFTPELGLRTTAWNRDVWGQGDTVLIAATDPDMVSMMVGYILRVERNTFKGIEFAANMPASSVWGIDGIWYCCGGRTVYRKDGKHWSQVLGYDPNIYRSVRGTSTRDVCVTLEGGRIMHFNGSTWAEIHSYDNNGFFYPRALTMSGSAVFSVGDVNQRAIVYRGYRQPVP
jgi:hypothetical protein